MEVGKGKADLICCYSVVTFVSPKPDGRRVRSLSLEEQKEKGDIMRKKLSIVLVVGVVICSVLGYLLIPRSAGVPITVDETPVITEEGIEGQEYIHLDDPTIIFRK